MGFVNILYLCGLKNKRFMSEERKKIKRIVLTGGPCAGKTSALVRVIEHFSNLGYKVFTIPEVPTMFTQAGMNYLTDNKAFFYEGEKATLEIQLALEDKFMRMAETQEGRCVVVCDRGTMDISAYMRPEMWSEITSAIGTTTQELRNRYDAVLHLVSAADGAEQFYTTSNNAQRLEQADEAGLRIARQLDKKVIKAWTGHPHLRVINNNVDFEQKLNRVLKEISNVLELPQPIETERKYIVEIVGSLPEECIESDITQTYLVGEPGSEIRLRRRTWDGKSVNIHTTKKTLSPTEELLTERQVSNNLYETLLQQADPYRRTIHKQRKSFIWQGQFFELDTYLDPHLQLSSQDGGSEKKPLTILETKGMACHEDIKFPPFLRVIEDITGNTRYYNYNLALKR